MNATVETKIHDGKPNEVTLYTLFNILILFTDRVHLLMLFQKYQIVIKIAHNLIVMNGAIYRFVLVGENLNMISLVII